jgi:ribosomal RNA-processing protein 1
VVNGCRYDTLDPSQVWLSSRKGLGELDLLKVWKGLFYCMWMSDKVPVQQQLAGNISHIVHCFGDDLERACLFITTFYKWVVARMRRPLRIVPSAH